ncbi:glycosyltransferase family 31 protein [Cadophora sp. DSE1049]|nr:glycosyltransferase family 31 protein [Cadophora sp. DSE1049]
MDFGHRLVVTVKTGATEAAEKIPVQLETTLRCVPLENVLWYSDMAQKVGGHQLDDALDQIAPSVKDGNLDFDIYRKQQELQDPVKVVSLLKAMKHPDDEDQLAAWSLDKYKNIHIIEKSWNARPHADWYIHIDADTYVLWPSFMAWIRKLDPSKKSFLGSMACLKELQFAHGGSGIVVSRAATEDLVVANNGTAALWDPRIAGNCCGDAILAEAFKEIGMPVMNAWPSINGESPSTIRFESSNWCQPIVTLHHISAVDAQRLRSFEDSRRDKSAPVLYSELFADLVWDMIPDSLENWDNMSDGVTVPNITSAAECARACERDGHCLQSLFNGEECKLGTTKITFGEKYDPENDEKTWQSTWNKKRIAAWVAKQSRCRTVKFPFEDGKTSTSSDMFCPP